MLVILHPCLETAEDAETIQKEAGRYNKERDTTERDGQRQERERRAEKIRRERRAETIKIETVRDKKEGDGQSKRRG